MLYTEAETATVKRLASTPTPSYVAPSPGIVGLDQHMKRQAPAIVVVKGKSSAEHVQDDMGLYYNGIFGDKDVAHGALEGAQTKLAAATVADTSTTINVDEDTDEYGNALFEAGMMVLIVSALPETIYKHHQDEVIVDCVEIGAAYVYGTTPKTAVPIIGFGTAGAIGKALALGAFVQPIRAFPSSLGNNGGVGVLPSYERPLAVSGLTATTATTAQVDTIEWTQHTELRSAGYVVGGFDVYIFKHGQGVCVSGPPTGIKPHFIPSLENTYPVPASSKHTVSNETDYFDQSTNALTTIDNGVFYIVVVARTMTDSGERVRYSPIATATVTVPS